jgi:hypothetical protein
VFQPGAVRALADAYLAAVLVVSEVPGGDGVFRAILEGAPELGLLADTSRWGELGVDPRFGAAVFASPAGRVAVLPMADTARLEAAFADVPTDQRPLFGFQCKTVSGQAVCISGRVAWTELGSADWAKAQPEPADVVIVATDPEPPGFEGLGLRPGDRLLARVDLGGGRANGAVTLEGALPAWWRLFKDSKRDLRLGALHRDATPD